MKSPSPMGKKTGKSMLYLIRNRAALLALVAVCTIGCGDDVAPFAYPDMGTGGRGGSGGNGGAMED